jgi:hypothetical protein
MSDIPDEMMQKGRGEDQNFSPEECLYRRVPHELWDDSEIELDSIELPDMSVNRQKYGPPEWVRLVGDNTANWGVIGFLTKDIPPEIQHLGVYIYKFRPVHVPLRRNYPHSEVRVYETPADRPESETHIGKTLVERITPDVSLRWREKLRRKCRIILHAYQSP